MPLAPLAAAWAGRARNTPGPWAATGTGPQIAATELDFWPSRILVSATLLGVGDLVTVYRVVGSTRTPIRGADAVTMTDSSLVVVDAEQPFGTPVTYALNVGGTDVASTTPTAHTLVGGKVALSDAIGGDAAEVVVLAWPDRTRTRVATTFVAGGRNIVVGGPLPPPAGPVELYTETDAARVNLVALLEGATSGVLLVRQPGGYAGVDSYQAFISAREVRWSQDGNDPRRRWQLELVEVQAWPAEFLARGYTLADIAAAYAGQTLADLAGDFPTLLA